jgi:HD-GYP domain-containing protein (c-di-GMP phosphodiesterase class II)
MNTTSPLPPNWTDMLDQIQQLLTQAVQLAETREASLANQTVHGLSIIPPNPIEAKLDELAEQVRQMEAPLLTLDRVLQSEEDLARGHVAKVADLSRRLAEWAGGAVG